MNGHDLFCLGAVLVCGGCTWINLSIWRAMVRGRTTLEQAGNEMQRLRDIAHQHAVSNTR